MSLLEQAQQIIEGVQTLKEWLGSGAETVPWRLAQARAGVCLKCPLNKPGSVLTGAVADAVKKQIELKNALQLRVSGEKSLHHCEGCGCVLRLKIWMPADKLGMTQEQLNNYPTACWMRKELQR